MIIIDNNINRDGHKLNNTINNINNKNTTTTTIK